uniref:Uncharacterized protein n=1 Tax=Emiliania huxleyi TaxID=2903 RepID=A0A7S3T6Y1_EMIHU
MRTKSGVVAILAASARPRAAWQRMVFPDSAEAGQEPRVPLSIAELQRRVTGFWTIYDDLATEDALSAVAGGESTKSLFSTNMVLRADGAVSRGSDFPGGEWSVVEDGSRRRRLRMTLTNRRAGLERRYDGLLFSLALTDPGTDGGGGGGEAAAVEEMKKVRYLVRGLSSTGAQSGLRAGFALMRSSLLAAEDRSLVLVVVSSLKDAAELVREEGALFKRKVRQVVIQGGVLPFSPGVAAAGEMLEPDSAHNNAFDAASSRFFYHRCQELGVPLLVLSRFAAYGCQVPRSTYDDLAATGGQIGRRLQETQRTSIERLWRRACAPADSPSRAGLPVRCDKRWFCDTFLGGDGRDRAEDVSIWDLVRGFNMYDPIALVAAVPALAERFFETDDLVVHGVRHRVVGVSADRSGVRPGSGLQEWLCAAFLEGARLEAAAEEGEEELPRSGSMGRPPWSRAERGAERGDSLDDPSLSPALGEGGQGSDTVHEE